MCVLGEGVCVYEGEGVCVLGEGVCVCFRGGCVCECVLSPLFYHLPLLLLYFLLLSSPHLTSPPLLSSLLLSPPFTSTPLPSSLPLLSSPHHPSPFLSRRQCCMLCAEFSPRSPWASMKSRKYDWDTWHEHTNSLSHTTGTFYYFLS